MSRDFSLTVLGFVVVGLWCAIVFILTLSVLTIYYGPPL